MLILPKYDVLLTMLLLLCLVPVGAFGVSALLAPTSQGAEKRATYESGIEPMGEAWCAS